jgi:hypothetical protein
MTVADLIRKGCESYPRQAYRTGFQDEDRACVRGAAHAGFAMETGTELSFARDGHCENVYDNGHPLNVKLCSVRIPLDEIPNDAVRKMHNFPASLKRVITILNDELEWSREEIAGWIEKNEVDPEVLPSWAD